MKTLLLAVLSLGLCVPAAANTPSRLGAIASAHPLATDVAASILEAGGNAVDAAVALSLALSVVEPWSSGLGGGAFMVVRMKGVTTTWDLRETAPQAATRDMYVKSGEVVPGLSTRSALASGIPGLVRGLAQIHRESGSLPFEQLVAPAIRLARDGFEVTQRLHEAITQTHPGMNAAAKRIFLLAGGRVPPVGHRLVQKDLATTLVRIAQSKGEDFYVGTTATELVRSVQAASGVWTLSDLKRYRAVKRAAVKGTFHGLEVQSMGPPSSGGLLLVQMLGVWEKLGLQAPRDSVAYVHAMAETSKRAFALRAKGLGDPDFVKVDAGSFTSPKVIHRVVRDVKGAGRATPAAAIAEVPIHQQERADTSHFGILMASGDAVACTQTINLRFGSGQVAGRTGVVLNNEMDDFSAQPGVPNAFGLIGAEANSIAPGKRPLSSMTPTIILRDGKAIGIFGSPGGSTIITTTFQSVVHVVAHGMTAAAALAAPRWHHQWTPDKIYYEAGSLDAASEKGLRGLGHGLAKRASMGNAMVIWRRPDGRIDAAADPRGEGSAWVR